MEVLRQHEPGFARLDSRGRLSPHEYVEGHQRLLVAFYLGGE
jgi:hypothetical protein